MADPAKLPFNRKLYLAGGFSYDLLCDGNSYTETDRAICELDCNIFNGCQLGNVPEMISLEDAELLL